MGQQAASQPDFSPTLTGQQQLAGLMQTGQTLANSARSDALKASLTSSAQAMSLISGLVGGAMGTGAAQPGGSTPSSQTSAQTKGSTAKGAQPQGSQTPSSNTSSTPSQGSPSSSTLNKVASLAGDVGEGAEVLG
jgi:hypothetical protein